MTSNNRISQSLISQAGRRSATFKFALIAAAVVTLAALLLSFAAGTSRALPTVLATIPVGGDPHTIALNTNTNRLYIGQSPSGVDVVDTTTDTEITPLPAAGANNQSIAVDPVRDLIYAAEQFRGAVEVFNGSGGLVADVSIGQTVFGVAVNTTTNKVYVVLSNSSAIRVLDGNAAYATIATIPLGSDLSNLGSASIAVDETTNTLYVVEKRAGRISIIDGSTDSVTMTVPVGTGAPDSIGGIAVNTITKRVYVAHSVGLTMINGTTGAVINTQAGVAGSFGVAVKESTDQVYVTVGGNNELVVIDGVTNAIVTTLTVGVTPVGVAVDPGTDHVYVANGTDNTISVVEDIPSAWRAGTSMPSARYATSGALGQDGKIYLFGGNNGSGVVTINEAFDPVTETWSSLAAVPSLVHEAQAFTAPNGLIYYVAGHSGTAILNSAYAYDPVANTWSAVTSLSTGRSDPGGALGQDGKIYIIGGFAPSGVTATGEAYDPVANTWSAIASMPGGPRYNMGAATGTDGRIYTFGGHTGNSVPLNTAEVYDPVTNTWSTFAAMPTARFSVGGALGVDGRIYAIGGFDNFQSLDMVEAYDPATNTWETLDAMPTARLEFATVVGADDRIYTFGGALSGNPASVQSIVEVFTPPAPTNQPPVAVADAYAHDGITALNVAAPGVLGNDSDPDTDPLTATLEVGTGPTNGLLTFNADGSFDYTANAGYCGADGFSYTASDGTVSSNIAAVSIDVTCNTEVGTGIMTVAQDPVTGDPTTVSVDFTEVTAAGDTTAAVSSTGPATPTGFKIGQPPTYYDITTTATFTGIIEICIDYSGITVPNESKLKMLHNTAGGWIDITSDLNIVTDIICGETTSFSIFTVAQENTPPAAVDDGYVTNEDTALNVAAPGVLSNDSDLDTDPLTATLEAGAGPTNGLLTLNADGSFTYTPNADFNGTDSFTYELSDGDGGLDTATVTITVTSVNDAPIVTADQASVAVDEGQIAANTGTVSDIDSAAVSLSASVGTVVDNNDGTWSWSFTTTDGPTESQTVTVTANDGDGGIAQATFGLTVANLDPAVGLIAAPLDPVQLGTGINTSVDFTDPGTSDTHTALWDWGDTTTSAGTVTETGGSGTVTGSHPYGAAGVYTLSVTITDDDGGSDQTFFLYVVIYDPAGGFVTGGGWINSPLGAYVAAPTLTGKANFGFVSKYQNGASTPTGQTQFRFKTAGLNFHSTDYEWLVIAGSKAMYKGSGTIDGGGDYGFLLTANDGQISGGGGVDSFRIKIWDKNNGDAVVYDNQLGDDDDADATTTLGGGSIVIHNS